MKLDDFKSVERLIADRARLLEVAAAAGCPHTNLSIWFYRHRAGEADERQHMSRTDRPEFKVALAQIAANEVAAIDAELKRLGVEVS